MTGYLLIESRDWFGTGDCEALLDLASGLSRDGQDVTLLLVQNGVLSARTGAASKRLARLAESGVEILADVFSLKERGISHNRMDPTVRAAPRGVVIDHLGAGRKAIWH